MGTADEELADVVRCTRDAAAAYMRGDMDRYLTLVRHARGFTLLPPYGGGPRRYDDRGADLRRAEAFMRAATRSSSRSRRTPGGTRSSS